MVAAVRALRQGGDATGGFFDFGRRPPTAGKRQPQKRDPSGSQPQKDKNKDDVGDTKLLG